ncbi:MAG: beta-propeller fold lactonase family protein [Chloroflexi bacterium]|nr:beta-propeller fold lactonase family protein [Chloroflexota bacterium]
MALRRTRRQFLRAVSAALGTAVAVVRLTSPERVSAATDHGSPCYFPATVRAAEVREYPGLRDDPPAAPSLPLDPDGRPNVWAATRGPIPPAVADIPPRVYVPHERGGDVAVIDPATMQIVDRYYVGRTPHHVAPSYDLGTLYVNVMDSNQLTAIDPRSGQPVGTVPAAAPYNLYFTPDGTRAIVVAERFNRLDFHDLSTWEVVARVQIPGTGADHLDFSADGTYLLIGCEFGGQIVKVALDPPQVVGVMNAGGLPVDVKLSPDGTVFFVANQGRHGLVVVDPAAMREVDFIPTGRGAHGLAVSRDTRALYVGNRLAGTISVVDFAAWGVAASWPIGGSPDMLQVSPDGQQVWVSGRNHGAVWVVDTNAGGVIATIQTGAAPHGLTYFPQPGNYSIGHNGVYR